MQRNREYGLVLAGGGTKGAYQVGAMKALLELNIHINAVAGTSIGAINGALFVQEGIKEAEELYKNITINDIMEVADGVDSSKNIFDISNITKIATEYTENKGISNEPLRNKLNKMIDIDKIYNSKIDFALVTVKRKDMSPVELFKQDIKKEQFIDFLLASACFPIFKPQEIEGIEYWDGGLYDNIPINTLLKKGYKNIIVLDVSGVGLKKKLLYKDIYLKVISPNNDLGGTFEFNQDKIKENINLGYLDTLKAFHKLQGHIYYFESEEFNKMLETFSLQTIYGLEYAAQLYNINKYEIYTFDEFISELKKKHTEAQEKYDRIKDNLKINKILEIGSQIKDVFDKGLGICFATDLYLDKPMSKKFDYLDHFMKDYMLSVKAILEVINYIK